MHTELKARMGMSSFQTKPTDKKPKSQDVNAGQWWRLNDIPSIGIIGDGGEARGVVLTESGEVMFRVYPSDWVVESSPEVFERFTNAEFNEHFRMIVRDTVKINLGEKDGAQEKDKEDSQC